LTKLKTNSTGWETDGQRSHFNQAQPTFDDCQIQQHRWSTKHEFKTK